MARVGRRRLPWSVVWGVGAGALVAGTAVVLWQGQSGAGADGPLDPNVAVVLPFTARGGGEELERLGEGLPMLLEPWLTGEGAPRAANAVKVERAWQARLGAGDGEATELSPEEARDLGRRLGAGQVWLGRLMAFPNEQVVINADVWQVADGERLGQAQVQGELDSVLVLIDQLVRDLLPQQAGERRGAAELTTTSLPAQRTYLEGRRLLASGQWEAAVAAFDRALERDSTFALAAFYLSLATRWGAQGTVAGIPRADSLVCALRDRLGRREQLLLSCDGEETPSEHRARVREAVRLAPDWLEAWYSYGDVLFHWGTFLRVPNATDSAAAAFNRAIALADTARREAAERGQVGSTLGDSYWVQHRIELAALAGDVATLRRLIALARPRSDSMETASTRRFAWRLLYYEWLLAWAEGDTTRGQALTEEMATAAPQVQLRVAIGYSQTIESIPLEAIAQLVDSARWTSIGVATRLGFALNRGRPQEARALTERYRREFGYTPGMAIFAGVAGQGDSAVAAAAAREYEEYAWQELAKAYPAPDARLALCVAQLWRLHQGDFSTIERVEQVVFDSVGGREIETSQDFRESAYMLSTLAAHKLGRADVPLYRLDSVLHGSPSAALLAASIRSERQDYQGALVTLRRRHLWDPMPIFESTILRLEGDLARRLGDREGAIEAYRRYLRLRSDPEPEMIPERDQVRQALAELIAEPQGE